MKFPNNYILILDSIENYQDALVKSKVNRIVTSCYGDDCKCVAVIEAKDIKCNILIGNADMYVFAYSDSPSKKFKQVLNNMSVDDYVLEIDAETLHTVRLDKVNKYVILMPWENMTSVVLSNTVKFCQGTMGKYLKSPQCVGGAVPKTGDMSPYNLFLDALHGLNEADIVCCYHTDIKDSVLYNAALDVAKLKRKAIMFI